MLVRVPGRRSGTRSKTPLAFIYQKRIPAPWTRPRPCIAPLARSAKSFSGANETPRTGRNLVGAAGSGRAGFSVDLSAHLFAEGDVHRRGGIFHAGERDASVLG